MVDHVVEEGDLSLLIPNNGKSQVTSADFVDVLDPSTMTLDCVCRQANELDAAFCELGLEFGEGAELGSADWSVVFRVREEDDPIVTNEIVEVDGTIGRISVEIRSDTAETQTDEQVSYKSTERCCPSRLTPQDVHPWNPCWSLWEVLGVDFLR